MVACSWPSAAPAKPAYGVVNQAILAEHEFDRMERGGVQTLRILIRRSWTEPARGQYDWSSVDPIVAEAAARGIGYWAGFEDDAFVGGGPSPSTRTTPRRPSSATGCAATPGAAAWRPRGRARSRS